MTAPVSRHWRSACLLLIGADCGQVAMKWCEKVCPTDLKCDYPIIGPLAGLGGAFMALVLGAMWFFYMFRALASEMED